jgi:peptidase M28-like protein
MRISAVPRVPLFLIAAACGRSSAVSSTGEAPAPIVSTTGVISASELRRDLYAFAADSFRGRETGTPDARRAAVFLAERLMAIGVEPAGDSMYVQRVPLLKQRLTADTRFTVSDERGTHVLALGTDVSPLLSLGEGAPEPRRSATGDLVFAGYGVQSKAIGRDDLSKVELEGKVVVIIHGAPPNVDEKAKQQLEGQPELTARLGRLLPFHPRAIVVLMNDGTRGFYDQIATELQRVVVPSGQRETSSDAERPLPMILLGVAKPGSPLLPAKWPDDDRPQALTGRRFAGAVQTSRDPFTAFNVVGVVRGTDRRLNQTYVAFGAHYDHIGVQPPVNGDSVANGADDDGSGSMALLAIARRLVAAPARRSALLVWHVGEEKGLLGSAYFTEHPTVPIDSVVAQLNADMIGRNAPQLLYVVGPQAAPNNQSKELGRIVDSVNAALPSPFAIDREYDAPDHPEQLYQRSDHYNYARQGVPIVFFTTGLHGDYHRVSDEPSKIDYDKLSRVATLILDVGKSVGDRGTRPR